MKYQFVLQFPENKIDFSILTEVEDDLSNILKNDQVDGHDIGSGQVNFFILTDNPNEAFKKIKQYLIDKELLIYAKAAYRPMEGKKYCILYPKSLKEFKIL